MAFLRYSASHQLSRIISDSLDQYESVGKFHKFVDAHSYVTTGANMQFKGLVLLLIHFTAGPNPIKDISDHTYHC